MPETCINSTIQGTKQCRIESGVPGKLIEINLHVWVSKWLSCMTNFWMLVSLKLLKVFKLKGTLPLIWKPYIQNVNLKMFIMKCYIRISDVSAIYNNLHNDSSGKTSRVVFNLYKFYIKHESFKPTWRYFKIPAINLNL